jgi:hypothetical protein
MRLVSNLKQIIPIPILKAILRWGALRPRMPYATRRICLSGKSSYQLTKMGFGIILYYRMQLHAIMGQNSEGVMNSPQDRKVLFTGYIPI